MAGVFITSSQDSTLRTIAKVLPCVIARFYNARLLPCVITRGCQTSWQSAMQIAQKAKQ
ncbi:hypothetical protein [Helicobacter sp. MIT 05-5294]|uniref:hypothetical protein n=1 Tax=Helicobacter sp. MIT 05-5294 TaxID=1548150 RepID=UPI001883199D|nr:hypothetical protein [Helicobacter sp. MIT 05-5294]